MTDLIALTTQASALIRAEVFASDERSKLDAAVRQAIRLGYSINDVSAATGLTPNDINRALEARVEMDDLATLAGAC